MRVIRVVIAVMLAFMMVSISAAHSGRTDKDGGHNSKNGYHKHSSPADVATAVKGAADKILGSDGTMPDYMEIIERNEFVGITFYAHKDMGTSRKARTFEPYIGVKDDGMVVLHIRTTYSADRRLYFDEVLCILTVGDELFRDRCTTKSYDKTYDGDCETVDIVSAYIPSHDRLGGVSFGYIVVLDNILEADKLQVRLRGDNGVWDVTFEDDSLKIIQETIAAYNDLV